MPASAEALLISALISTQSIGTETTYGIGSDHFEGYSDEYTWLTSYVATYACQPSRDIFSHKFPGFPWSEHTDVQSAAEMVHQAVNRRRITAGVNDAMDHLHLGDADAAYAALMAAKPMHSTPPPRPLLTDTDHLYRWDSKPYRIEVPYPTLQRVTGGITAGDLWYVAARPGQGKSAHLGSIAVDAILGGNRVCFYSLEMSEDEVRGRFHAALATKLGYRNITATNLRNHHVDLAEYKKFIGELGEKLVAVDGVLDVLTPADGPVSPSTVAARAGDYDLSIVDYVGLMACDAGGVAIDDWRMMAKISNSLKSTALASKTGILCAAQINRDGETGSAPPKVKNLAQSDALGQDGDVVLTMRSKPKNVATYFSIEKNRHGACGINFHTTFDPNTGSYTEISADHAEDLVINAEALEAQPMVPPKLRVVAKEET